MTEAISVVRATREVPSPKTGAATPRHVAIVLNGRSDRRGVLADAAAAAIRAMLAGCAESGVAVLTLIRPEFDAVEFDAAVSSIGASTLQANGIKLNLASPRSGRHDLLESVRRIAAQAKRDGVSPAEIKPDSIEAGLSTRGLPPVDLLISTGGGATLSGALLWQSAYAELLFADVPWFAFSRADFDAALADYSKRCRKFGGLA